MYTKYARFNKAIYSITLLTVVTILLGGCDQARHQLDMEETPQQILDRKLKDRNAVLTPNQSITLIDHCAELGEGNADNVAGKVVAMTVGNTGVGKSTFLNCLVGCKMKLVKPRELGLSRLKKVVIVDPDSQQPEIMPIGHKASQTFLPQIAIDASNQGNTYCDCPGFSDNRGPEINIANAINTRRVLQQAKGVKVIFLTGYNGLSDDRGDSIEAMEEMCRQMFGGVDNLRKCQEAVLLGITKAPLYEDDEPLTCDVVKEQLMQSERPIAKILAKRIFLFDPLDRGNNNPDFWSIARCRNEIAKLNVIPQRSVANLFQTVLTDRDQTKLKLIMRAQAQKLAAALELDDYEVAGKHWQSLARLKVIESDEVERMVGEHALVKIQQYVSGCVGTFTKYAAQYQFEAAERQLALLKMLVNHFPNADLKVNVTALEKLLTQYKEKKAEEQRSTDQKLAVEKRKAVKKVQEAMEQELEQLRTQLHRASQVSQQPDISVNLSFTIPLDK
ncbi:MAG: hypothetical protein ACX93T_00215 [Bacteroidota bacterium]